MSMINIQYYSIFNVMIFDNIRYCIINWYSMMISNNLFWHYSIEISMKMKFIENSFLIRYPIHSFDDDSFDDSIMKFILIEYRWWWYSFYSDFIPIRFPFHSFHSIHSIRSIDDDHSIFDSMIRWFDHSIRFIHSDVKYYSMYSMLLFSIQYYSLFIVSILLTMMMIVHSLFIHSLFSIDDDDDDYWWYSVFWSDIQFNLFIIHSYSDIHYSWHSFIPFDDSMIIRWFIPFIHSLFIVDDRWWPTHSVLTIHYSLFIILFWPFDSFHSWWYYDLMTWYIH